MSPLLLACPVPDPPADPTGATETDEVGSDTTTSDTTSDTTTTGDTDTTTSGADSTSDTDTGGAVCGDAVVEGDEGCDDGNADESDGCLSTCTVARICHQILAEIPSAADGVYSIDPDGEGGNPMFEAYCDMSTDGGGWTLAAKVHRWHAGDPYVEPDGWFAEERDVDALLDIVSYEDRPAAVASHGQARLGPVLDELTTARFVTIAEDDPMQRASWFKGVDGEAFSWFSTTPHTATRVCDDPELMLGCAAGRVESGSVTILEGMGLEDHGYATICEAIHMRIDVDDNEYASGVCSCTLDLDANAWNDDADVMWGNGLEIWLRDGETKTEEEDRLVVAREQVGIWTDPSSAMAANPPPDVSFDNQGGYLDVEVVNDRLFAAQGDALHIYEPFDLLMGGATPSVELPLDVFPGSYSVLQGDSAGRLWFVGEDAFLRWNRASAIHATQQPQARLEPPGASFLGAYHEGSDRAFVGNTGVLWIWNDASTRVGTDTSYDDELIIGSDSFVIAGDRLIVSEYHPDGPRLSIYDPATLSAASPDPTAMIELADYARPIHAWGDLAFASFSGTTKVYDLDTLSLLTEIPYVIDMGPPWPDELLYTSNGVLRVLLNSRVELWTDVPDSPTLSQTLEFDETFLPPRGLAVFECLIDAECTPGRCIAGRCTAM